MQVRIEPAEGRDLPPIREWSHQTYAEHTQRLP